MNAVVSESVVNAQGLRKAYRNKLALDDTSFNVGAGRIVGLIGPNGAGKTTALKAILGLTAFEGTLKVLGLDPRHSRDALMNDVCFIADVAVLPRWLRVGEAIDFVAGVHPRFDRAKCERFLANTQLNPKLRVRELSKGMIVQLHLALVMAIDARLLVLDEPTLGLDILYRKQFYQRLLEDYFDEEKDHPDHHPPGRGDRAHPHRRAVHPRRQDRAERGDGTLGRPLHRSAGPGRCRRRGAPVVPIDERSLPFGKSVLLFDGIPKGQLATLGETRTPGLADLFVAIMKGTYA